VGCLGNGRYTIPYPGVYKVKVKVNAGVKVNIRRRLGEGIAKSRRRPARASPRPSVTKARQSQCRSPIPMGKKDHGGSDAVGRPQIPIIRGSNKEKRKVASRP